MLMDEEESAMKCLSTPDDSDLKITRSEHPSCNEDFSSPITFTNEDGQTILVTLADPIISDQEVSVTDTSAGESVDQQPAVLDILVTTVNEHAEVHHNGINKTEKDKIGISQNWITSKTDKRVLQDQGHRWKQGQWTSEENEILKRNIDHYCETKGIPDPNSIIFEMSKDMRKDFYRVIAQGLDRPLFSVYRRVIRMYDQKNHLGKYSAAEIAKLKELRAIHGNDWAKIGAALGRSAGSVRDRCRLMKDSCTYGTWHHEEEMRLSNAVYELSGAQPGEEVHHGLCWANVAAKVKTRTEKQCRAKWLNFLNWKQKGGAEWSGAADDAILLDKIMATQVNDESEVDWTLLSKGWSSARSPQWLRSKWWALKRQVPNYQTVPFHDLLSKLTMITSNGQRKARGSRPESSLFSDSLSGELKDQRLAVSKYLPLRVCGSDSLRITPTIQLTDGGHTVISDDLSLDSNPFHLVTSSSNNAFLIANNESVSLPLSSITEPLIVHALPFSECGKQGVSILGEVTDGMDTTTASDEIILLGEVGALSDGSVSTDHHHHHHLTHDGQEMHVLVPSGTTSHETLIHLSSMSDPLLNGQPTDLGTDG